MDHEETAHQKKTTKMPYAKGSILTTRSWLARKKEEVGVFLHHGNISFFASAFLRFGFSMYRVGKKPIITRLTLSSKYYILF